MLDISESDFGGLLIDPVSSLAAALLLSQNVDGGIFSRITMTSMTGAWYKPITNFEAILVGLVILEIFIMRYLLILPVDFTKWIGNGVLIGTSVSKRKRRDASFNFTKEKGLIDSMLTVLRRLDKEDCFLRSLCELQWHQAGNHPLPKKISTTLKALKSVGRKGMEELPVFKNETLAENGSVLSQLNEAVLLGDEAWLAHSNTTVHCESRYHICPLKEGDIMDFLQPYFKILNHI